MGLDRARLGEALMAVVAEAPPARELPQRLCAACQPALPVDGVGLTLVTDDQDSEHVLLGASDDIGTQIEHLQADLSEGPCRTALSTARPVLIAEMGSHDAHHRWPLFTRHVAALPVGALFAFPLLVGTSGLGVMDCHRTQTGSLADVGAALTVADELTLAVLNYTHPDLFASDTSPDNHAVVHQATGWLAAALGISAAEALARLRRYAFASSQPLRAVAEEVLAGRLHQPPPTP
jgi:hypothetical protein